MSTAVIKKNQMYCCWSSLFDPPAHMRITDCKCDCELHNVRIEKFSVIIDDVKLYRVRLNYVYDLHADFSKFCLEFTIYLEIKELVVK